MAEAKRQVSVRRIREVVGAPAGDAGDAMVRGISQPGTPEPDTVIVVSAEDDLNDALGVAAVIVVPGELAESAHRIGVPVAVTGHVRHALRLIIDELFPVEAPKPGIDPRAVVADTATIDASARIDGGAIVEDGAVIGVRTRVMAGAFVGRSSVIGDDCILHPGATVCHDVTVGDRVTLHAGSVIGSDGFGYVEKDGVHHKMQQIGSVVLGDDVEVGANSTIDRGAVGDTVIGEGSKIDNLVQIGHNVKTGRGCIFVAASAVAGSAVLGDYVIVAGQAGVKDHITLASGTVVAARSGLIKDTDKPGVYVGFPAVPHREYAKTAGLPKQVDRLKKRLSELEKKINDEH